MMCERTKGYKRVQSVPTKKRDISKTEVSKVYEKTGVIEYEPMLNELKRRTHLPKWIVKKVYETEGDILYDLGIMD